MTLQKGRPISGMGWKRRALKLEREYERYARLVSFGQRLSNFLYNAAQASDIPEPWRRGAKVLVDSWDAEKVRKP